MTVWWSVARFLWKSLKRDVLGWSNAQDPPESFLKISGGHLKPPGLTIPISFCSGLVLSYFSLSEALFCGTRVKIALQRKNT